MLVRTSIYTNNVASAETTCDILNSFKISALRF